MKMFGVLSVERTALPHEDGSTIRNATHGTAEVASRSELFGKLMGALPAEWQQDSVIVNFFYAEPDTSRRHA